MASLNEGLSQLKLLQYEEDGGAEAEAVKGEAEDEEEGESGQSLEVAAETSNEQDGRVPGQHDDESVEQQGRMEGFHPVVRPFF